MSALIVGLVDKRFTKIALSSLIDWRQLPPETYLLLSNVVPDIITVCPLDREIQEI
jgi:hypothetical protein